MCISCIQLIILTCFFTVAYLESLRSDKNLLDMFESLYPDQVEHAEMLIDTSKVSQNIIAV